MEMFAGPVRYFQRVVALQPRKRGCHLVTDEILSACPEIKQVQCGTLHLFLKHTSASLTLNENWDSDVRLDLNDALDKLAPEAGGWRHSAEGPDDMPGHIKSSLMGVSHTLPVSRGSLCLGTWQGVWLCEHRNRGGSRKVVVTLQGVVGEDDEEDDEEDEDEVAAPSAGKRRREKKQKKKQGKD